MKVIILAGGYGTRLQRDLEAPGVSGKCMFGNLLGLSKALLPIGRRPLISHWMNVLENCRDTVSDIFVVSNDFFLKQLEKWAKDWPDIKLLTDGTSTNETRSGAVACINLGVESCGYEDDVVVIGGDTLFLEDFSLQAVLDQFKKRKQEIPGACLVVTCPCEESQTVQYGILETDVNGRVTAFLEKPLPEETTSRKSCPCFYILSRESLPLINQFLEEKKNGPLKDRDATGNLIRYLYSRIPVFAFDVADRFDVGSLGTYITCNRYFLYTYSTFRNIKLGTPTPGSLFSPNFSKMDAVQNRLPATYLPGFHEEMTIRKMKYNKLGRTGLDVSIVGLGGSPFGNVYKPVSLETAAKVTCKAIKSGINYIDTAPWYGDRKSETVLGKCLKSVPRETYYIATKVGRYKPEVDKMFDFSAEQTVRSVDESLSLLGLDYVDLVQVHDVEFAPDVDIIINECLPALQKLKNAGKVKHIGITGYPLSILREVLERSSVQIDVVLSYCRLTMWDAALLDLIAYFKEKGVGLINAAPIGMGLLSHKGPRDWHPASSELRQACQDAALYCQSENVNISKLAMHFALSHGDVDVTLVGMESEDIVESNLKIVFESLTETERVVMDNVIQRFLSPVKDPNWEGVALKEYWKELKGVDKQK